MSFTTCVWAIDCFLNMKVFSCLHFNKKLKPLKSFVFLSSLLSTSNEQRAKERSQTLFGNSNECNLKRYLISQCLRRKICSEIVFELSWGASGWRGSHEGRSCWSGVRSPDTSNVGRMWLMQMSPSAVSVHAALTGTVMLSLTKV